MEFRNIVSKENFELNVSGCGDIYIYLLNKYKDLNNIKIKLGGVSNIYMLGENIKCKKQKIIVAGKSNYDGKSIDAETTDINIKGISKIKIKTKELNGKVSGASTVTCTEKPQVINVKRSGISQLKYPRKRESF